MTTGKDQAHAVESIETLRQLKLAETFFNHSVSCLVILDRDYNFIRVNEAYARACRRDIDDFVGYNHFELYPSDAKAIFDEVVHSKRPYFTFTRAFEFKDQPERGITYWDWTLVPVLDNTGEVEFLVFSLVEVTERKRAEEALRVAALVYQHSSEAMMVADASNTIIDINDAFCRLTGYAHEELIGKHTRILQSGRQSAEFYRDMWARLSDCGHWKGELWDKTKEGAPIAIQLAINTVYNDAGGVDRRVALFSDITEKKVTDALIWQQANFDALTRLPNRYMFHDRLRAHLLQAGAAKVPSAVLLIDLDQFKEVNDTLGHDKGDSLLLEVSRRVIECLPPEALCARLGGDEFAVVLSGTENVALTPDTAKQIIDYLAAPYRLGAETVYISASIGIAQFPDDGEEMETLLRHADQAMYAAKNAGRNRWFRFTQALQEASQQRLRLTNDLRHALADNQFEVHYQPIVELTTGNIYKAEALLRWQHPLRGQVSPAEFIPLAEASGLIDAIGEWVFTQATAQLQRLRDQGLFPFQLSINVSPVQIRNDGDLSARWTSQMANAGLPARSVAIEITEGLLLDGTPEVRSELAGFCRAGVQISLDDFGTGYSSLAYLKKFDIDFLKIDRAFVRNLESESDDRALCEAIIVMAHKLGLQVIAEGVETAAQRDFLAGCGCDYGQGFLFAKALPAASLESLLAFTV